MERTKTVNELLPGDFIKCIDPKPSNYVRRQTADLSLLVEGEFYELERVSVHTWYTKVYIKDVPGWYNSVAFSQFTWDNLSNSWFIVRD